MSEKLVVDEKELYDLYSTLADATTAASTGDTNSVAKHSAEAKDKVIEIRRSATPIKEAEDAE
jgi:hypothetical protein